MSKPSRFQWYRKDGTVFWELMDSAKTSNDLIAFFFGRDFFILSNWEGNTTIVPAKELYDKWFYANIGEGPDD